MACQLPLFHNGLTLKRNLRLFVRLGLFVVASSTAYVALATVFGLNCLLGGHNMMEALYGGFATYLLALVAGAEGAWLLGDG